MNRSKKVKNNFEKYDKICQKLKKNLIKNHEIMLKSE